MGSAAVSRVIFPIFQVACPEEFPEQFDEVLVGNTPSDDADEDMVVDVVKAALDVALYEPFHACERPLYFGQTRMTAPIRPEPVRMDRKSRFIDGLQHDPDYLLHQFVICRWNTQWPFFAAVFLCDILPLGWLWLIAVVFQRCDDSIDPCHTHAIQRIPVCSRCHAPL